MSLSSTLKKRRVAGFSFVRTLFFLILSVAVLGLFFGIRLRILALDRENRPLFSVPYRTQRAMADAERILDGEDFRSVLRGGHDDKGFALLVAAAWKISGHRSLETIHGMTLVSDLVAMLALSLCVFRVFGTFPAWITALLYAVYLPVGIEVRSADVQILQTHYALVLLFLVLWFPSRLTRQVGVLLVMSGVAVLASMVRGTVLFYPAALAFALFLKTGGKRGVVLASLLLGLSVGGFVLVKWVFHTPTHIVSHHLYTGLADFPNPLGIVPLDTAGWEEARGVSHGCEPYSPEYLRIVRARALTLISENTSFYLKLLAERAWKLLFCAQKNWWFCGFGLSAGAEKVVTWTFFSLFLVGLFLAWKLQIHDAFFFLVTFLYFTACIYFIVTINTNYFMTASVMQVPFVSLVLSRVRLRLDSQLGCPGETRDPVSESWWVSPLRGRFLAFALPATVFLYVSAVTGVLVYATGVSRSWKEQFLERLSRQETLEEWRGSDLEETLPGASIEIARFGPIRTGVPHVFHSVLEIERGRVAFQVFDASGNPLSDVVHSTGLGRIHCFIGWLGGKETQARLQIWDAPPVDPKVSLDDWKAPTRMETFRHYALQDHAKKEFTPQLEIKVSYTLFPNGHHLIPFRVDKIRWSRNRTVRIPAYWAAERPCSATLEFPDETEVAQVFLWYSQGCKEAPSFLVQGKGALFFQPIRATQVEQAHHGARIRYAFRPVSLSRLAIRFDPCPGMESRLYLKDVSIPDTARFKILRTTLVRWADPNGVTGAQDGMPESFPTRLSFVEP